MKHQLIGQIRSAFWLKQDLQQKSTGLRFHRLLSVHVVASGLTSSNWPGDVPPQTAEGMRRK